MEFLDNCQKFISIDSSPHAGSKEIASLAADLCQDAGLKVKVLDEIQNGLPQSNVIAANTDELGNYKLVLQTHLDTTDPGNFGLWTRTGSNPFQATIYENKIFGLGSADVKLDFLCKLEAIKKVGVENIKYPIALVGTYGEELGMTGTIKLLKKSKMKAECALIGEPTDLKIVNSGKGLALVDLSVPFSEQEIQLKDKHNNDESTSSQSRIFTGKQSHSAVASLESNAIWKMLDYFQNLPDGIIVLELEGGINYNTVADQAFLEIDMGTGISDPISKKIKSIFGKINEMNELFGKFPDERFNPPTTTLNIGKIETRGSDILFKGCVRIPPSVNEENYLSWMSDLQSFCKSLGANFTVVGYKPPFDNSGVHSEGSEFSKVCSQALEACDLDKSYHSQAATNEANIFNRRGISTLVFGPGKIEGNAHTPHEHVEIADLHKAIDFYTHVIKGL